MMFSADVCGKEERESQASSNARPCGVETVDDPSVSEQSGYSPFAQFTCEQTVDRRRPRGCLALIYWKLLRTPSSTLDMSRF